MIRIWLGAEDIARTRIAPACLPLHEVFVSLAAAPADPDRRDGPGTSNGSGPPGASDLRRWLRQLWGQPAGSARAPTIGRAVESTGIGRAAEPTGGSQSSNLLAALPEEPSLDAALAALRAGPAGRDPALVAAIRSYYQRWVASELAVWEPVVRLDVGERSRVLASGGVQALLAMLDPWAGWRSPVLTVASTLELDLRPDGAGLLLVPSVFARQLWVGSQPGCTVVVYPVCRPRPSAHRPGPAYARRSGCPPAGDPLTALLGRSRAAVLRAARLGANTTDLARRAGISAPSASQHASVLREAGLLRTTRHGKAAHHTLTPLARALLTGPFSSAAAGAGRPEHGDRDAPLPSQSDHVRRVADVRGRPSVPDREQPITAAEQLDAGRQVRLPAGPLERQVRHRRGAGQ